ncbi:uncharacterized protein LACBIDRAFT_329144 [Laccaria bicolor S238N-H82]|uniref:Predicted protein n=1 Tax=Laccaria bicolor (strain S238N-H82 / ATCC MYA-4686) TaxID=486041 RepID=B0DH74_LACBS|nr:uncharacterized protein LACBIDRAFT_329144 [Laccaria bicolor S238N-H82]EDR06060.1 predicted protein [Laccaria bicolor S238N-H82]|eukprot:XP_001883348.1 predicted protein [Laccaria bicolor S238N-H82]
MQNPDHRPLPNGWTERYDVFSTSFTISQCLRGVNITYPNGGFTTISTSIALTPIFRREFWLIDGFPISTAIFSGGGSTTSPPISPADATQFAVLAAQAPQRAKIFKQVGISVGKTAGKAALQIAGNAALLSVGIPPGLAIDVGTSILNSNTVGALIVNAFLSASTGVNLSTLLAVLQGQPGADYQGIINVLKLQQQRLQRQPQAPSVDYQALLTELTRILLLLLNSKLLRNNNKLPHSSTYAKRLNELWVQSCKVANFAE